MSRVLVVSEDAAVAERLESTDCEGAFEVTQTRWAAWDVNALAGAGHAASAADVFLLDYRDPASIPAGVAGLLAVNLRERDPQTPVVFIADLEPALREAVQAAVGTRKVTFAGAGAFADVSAMREVLREVLARFVGPQPDASQPGTQPASLASPAPGDGPTVPAVPSGTAGGKARAFPHLLPELRNPKTGRLDAKRVSTLFAVPLNRLAKSLGVDPAAVYKTPDAPALQTRLLLYERVAKSLLSLVGSEEGLRIWLNTPEPDLDNEIPRDLLLNGEGEVVAALLEDMQDGQPG